jgi:alkaline phosphatase
MSQAQAKLEEIVNRKYNTNNAKNVIMFLGDGMSIATIASARMLLGGEESNLYFENFPHNGFSKVNNKKREISDD